MESKLFYLQYIDPLVFPLFIAAVGLSIIAYFKRHKMNFESYKKLLLGAFVLDSLLALSYFGRAAIFESTQPLFMAALWSVFAYIAFRNYKGRGF